MFGKVDASNGPTLSPSMGYSGLKMQKNGLKWPFFHRLNFPCYNSETSDPLIGVAGCLHSPNDMFGKIDASNGPTLTPSMGYSGLNSQKNRLKWPFFHRLNFPCYNWVLRQREARRRHRRHCRRRSCHHCCCH